MSTSYTNVPDIVCDEAPAMDEARRPFLRTTSPRIKFAAAGLVLLAVAGSLVALKAKPAHGPLRRTSPDTEGPLVLASERDLMRIQKEDPGCAKLWEQCGSEGWTGPTCCEEGDCIHTPLLSLSSYRQCRTPEPPACGEVVPDSQCAKMIYSLKYDLERTPENFKGLYPGMDDKEYQLYAHWGISDESHCPEPCADSTCFVALHIIGCDTLDAWYCSHDDGSLKFACCCKYMHEESFLDKPMDVEPDYAKAIEDVESNLSTLTLFCTAMVTTTSYEMGLMQEQYRRGKLGLFGCDKWAVYSNESLRITPKGDTPEIWTTLINGSLSAEVGGNWGTALNTDVFIKFWNSVMEDPKALTCDWIVKVDLDAVFLPVRLKSLLRTTQGPLGQPEPEGGFWLNNCYLGLHGPIEVLSKRALATYNASQQECAHGDVAKIKQEDYFMRECWAKIGIQKVDAYNLLMESDFACGEIAASPGDKPPCFAPQVAFHPFKSVSTWMRCHHEAANHPWALPFNPITDAPSEATNNREQ